MIQWHVLIPNCLYNGVVGEWLWPTLSKKEISYVTWGSSDLFKYSSCWNNSRVPDAWVSCSTSPAKTVNGHFKYSIVLLKANPDQPDVLGTMKAGLTKRRFFWDLTTWLVDCQYIENKLIWYSYVYNMHSYSHIMSKTASLITVVTYNVMLMNGWRGGGSWSEASRRSRLGAKGQSMKSQRLYIKHSLKLTIPLSPNEDHHLISIITLTDSTVSTGKWGSMVIFMVPLCIYVLSYISFFKKPFSALQFHWRRYWLLRSSLCEDGSLIKLERVTK